MSFITNYNNVRENLTNNINLMEELSMAFKNYGESSKKSSGINYKVIEKFGVLDSDSDAPKELRLISWNGGTPKYDLRGWYEDEEGNERMTKGVTLDREELLSLYEILKEMDSEEEDGDDEDSEDL